MKRLVIIPAAGLATRMMPMSASMSKAMIPVAGQPILSHIIESIKDKVDHIVVVHGQLNDISNFLSKKNYHNVSWCPQDPEHEGPLGAICSGMLEYSKINPHHAKDYFTTVWLGDTLINSSRYIDFIFSDFCSTPNNLYLAVSKVPDWSRWCMITADGNEIIDKPKDKPDTDLALIGIYNMNIEFYKLLDNLMDSVKYHEEEIQDILEKYTTRITFDVSEPWLDCGDLPSLYIANNKMISSTARGHNSIRIEDGIVYKKSSRHEHEIKWYKDVAKLPIEVNALVPKFYGETEFLSEYAIEFCSGNTLQDLVLYHNINRQDVWDNIINSVLNKINKMHSFKDQHRLLGDGDRKRTEYMMYTNFCDRYISLRGDNIIDTAEHYILYDFLQESYDMLLQSYVTTSDVIHGDLHFGNIIFDATCNKTKLVDPRGSWGSGTLHTEGNALYDLAKLYQSVIGKYCHISTDTFPSDNENTIYDMIEQSIDNNLLQWYAPSDVIIAKRYAICLLASAIPLHSDNEKRQHIMKNTAIDLIKSGKY